MEPISSTTLNDAHLIFLIAIHALTRLPLLEAATFFQKDLIKWQL